MAKLPPCVTAISVEYFGEDVTIGVLVWGGGGVQIGIFANIEKNVRISATGNVMSLLEGDS